MSPATVTGINRTLDQRCAKEHVDPGAEALACMSSYFLIEAG